MHYGDGEEKSRNVQSLILNEQDSEMQGVTACEVDEIKVGFCLLA